MCREFFDEAAKLMHQTLEAVRKAVNAVTPLNQVWLSIKFTKADERKNLIEWMQECISAVGDDYEAKKKSHYQSLGYEEGSGIGQLTVHAKTAEEIADGFLGLGDGLKITQFVFTPARFGIPDPTPQVDITEGRIVVSPNPVGRAKCAFAQQAQTCRYQDKYFLFLLPTCRTLRKACDFRPPLWMARPSRAELLEMSSAAH